MQDFQVGDRVRIVKTQPLDESWIGFEGPVKSITNYDVTITNETGWLQYSSENYPKFCFSAKYYTLEPCETGPSVCEDWS